MVFWFWKRATPMICHSVSGNCFCVLWAMVEAEKVSGSQVAGINSELEGLNLKVHLVGAFFKDHVRQYRKRPIYWLLQSPKRTFSALSFPRTGNGKHALNIAGEPVRGRPSP